MTLSMMQIAGVCELKFEWLLANCTLSKSTILMKCREEFWICRLLPMGYSTSLCAGALKRLWRCISDTDTYLLEYQNNSDGIKHHQNSFVTELSCHPDSAWFTAQSTWATNYLVGAKAGWTDNRGRWQLLEHSRANIPKHVVVDINCGNQVQNIQTKPPPAPSPCSMNTLNRKFRMQYVQNKTQNALISKALKEVSKNSCSYPFQNVLSICMSWISDSRTSTWLRGILWKETHFNDFAIARNLTINRQT